MALDFPFALAFVAVDLTLEVVFPAVLAEAFPLDLLSFLSMDLTVGGSCRLSPARISLFALRIGIQQT